MNVRHIEMRPYFKLMKADIEGLSPDDYIKISTALDNCSYIIKVSKILDRYEKGIGAPNGKPSVHWNSNIKGVSASEGVPLWIKEQAKSEVPLIKKMKSWIFQGNPDKFDMDSYLIQDLESITWRVSQYKKDVRIGDEVFIWRAKGKNNAQSGIIARGTITSEVQSGQSVANAAEFWTDKSEVAKERNYIYIQLHEVNRGAGMLMKETLLTNNDLKELHIIKNPIGTVSPLSDIESETIRTLWKDNSQWDVNDSSLGNKSPRLKMTSVKTIERSAAVVKATKQRAKFKCEVKDCSQALFKTIKQETYVEVHHLLKLADGGPDTLDNTVSLCPHHHREIHYGKNAEFLTNQLKQVRDAELIKAS